jgi:hypothetical protein
MRSAGVALLAFAALAFSGNRRNAATNTFSAAIDVNDEHFSGARVLIVLRGNSGAMVQVR